MGLAGNTRSSYIADHKTTARMNHSSAAAYSDIPTPYSVAEHMNTTGTHTAAYIADTDNIHTLTLLPYPCRTSQHTIPTR